MPASPRKPRVTINVAMSADGKISTHRRETFALGSKADRYLMDVLRARADAVVVGSTTVDRDGWAIRVRDTALRSKRAARRGEPHPLNVVLSTRLDVSSRREFFEHAKTCKLIVTTRQAPAGRIRRFEKLGEVLVLPGKSIRPSRVLAELERRGCTRILLEGGGALNFSFFRDGLVDEIYLTVTPRILGGRGAPTPADGRGFVENDQIPLELVSSRRKGEEVFLRYRVKRPDG